VAALFIMHAIKHMRGGVKYAGTENAAMENAGIKWYCKRWTRNTDYEKQPKGKRLSVKVSCPALFCYTCTWITKAE